MKIVVACDRRRGIGLKNSIPWKIPEDIKLFKAITMGHTVVMGRKTWESLPKSYKPLPGRTNMVLTRGENNTALTRGDVKGIEIIKDINDVPHDAIIIGGAQIYKLALEQNLVDSILCSMLKSDYECDTYFPPLDVDWKMEKILDFPQFELLLFQRLTS